MILEAWKRFEYKYGDNGSQNSINSMMPRKVKKRRKVQGEDNDDVGWEEYFDYIFPDDENNQPNIKLLEMAKLWKQNKEDSSSSDSDSENDNENTTEQQKNEDKEEDSDDSSDDDDDENVKTDLKDLPLPLPLNIKDLDKDEVFSDDSTSSDEDDE